MYSFVYIVASNYINVKFYLHVMEPSKGYNERAVRDDELPAMFLKIGKQVLIET